MLKVQIPIELTDEEYASLWAQASREGFPRAEPRKPWNPAEVKLAVRWVLAKRATGDVKKANELIPFENRPI